jgi:NADPH:quinone reductase-like Zn-dependent oxidoreductase
VPWSRDARTRQKSGETSTTKPIGCIKRGQHGARRKHGRGTPQAPDELRHRADDLFRWIREGTLKVRIGGRYPLDQAARAHEDLAARRTTGKLILLAR